MKNMLSEVSHSRRNNFDFLRFALASLVILSHSYPLVLGSNKAEPFAVMTAGQRTGGEFAVDGFFILSGFLIAKSWQSSRNLGQFLRSRVFRIYPGFLVAVAFSSLIAAPSLSADPTSYWHHFSWPDFLAQSLNLNLYSPPGFGGVNGSLWSIRYEFMCYLAVAFLGLSGLISRRPVLLLALFVCLGIYAGQIYFHWRPLGTRLSWLYCYPEPWPRLMSNFMAGILFFVYRDRVALSWPLMFTALLSLLILAVALPSLAALPLAIPLLGGYVLLFFSFVPIPHLDKFAARGDLSYGLYLYAMPIQFMLVRASASTLTPLTLFLLALPTTLLVAELSWRLIERPCLKFKQSPKPIEHPTKASATPQLIPA